MERHSLRVAMLGGHTTVTLDLDTAIDASCFSAATLFKGMNDSPIP